MGFEIKKNTAFGAPLGTEILGIKLEDINKSVSSKIEKALNDYHVIVFRKQALSPEAQVNLTKIFGTPNVHVRASEFSMPDYPSINLVTNIQKDGKSIGSAYAGITWHIDFGRS